MARTRLLVVDDHAVLRAGLRALLSNQPDLEVVGEAATGWEAAECARRLRPDVVLMDIAMPNVNGIEATARLKREYSAARILVLTMHEDERYLHAALRAGASGYIVKRAADSDLVGAIRAVARGEMFVHSSMIRALVDDALGTGTPRPTADASKPLSEREQEVLRLIALGHTYQQIAERLIVSPKTVATYKARIMEKLGIQGRNALVRYAIEQGWLESPERASA